MSIPGQLVNTWTWQPSPNNGCRVPIRCRGHGTYILVTNIAVREPKVLWTYKGRSGTGTTFQRSGRYVVEWLEAYMHQLTSSDPARTSWSGTWIERRLQSLSLWSSGHRRETRFSVSSTVLRPAQDSHLEQAGRLRISAIIFTNRTIRTRSLRS